MKPTAQSPTTSYTADTITDDQVRELRTTLKRELREGDKWNELFVQETKADIETCTIALTDRRAMAYMMAGVAEGVRKARERCARMIADRRTE